MLQIEYRTCRVCDPVHPFRKFFNFIAGLYSVQFQIFRCCFYVRHSKLQPCFGMGIVIYTVEPYHIVSEFYFMCSGNRRIGNRLFFNLKLQYIPVKSDRFFIFIFGILMAILIPASNFVFIWYGINERKYGLLQLQIILRNYSGSQVLLRSASSGLHGFVRVQ